MSRGSLFIPTTVTILGKSELVCPTNPLLTFVVSLFSDWPPFDFGSAKNPFTSDGL